MAPTESSPKRKTIMLTVTEACNLRCTYCYQAGKSNRRMRLEKAKEIVRHEFGNSSDFDELQFDLFGGEPTLCKDFLISLVEWTLEQQFGKPFIFFLQTNGTLVHGAFQDWLRSHAEYVCAGLSLDGLPKTHNGGVTFRL